MLFNQYLLKLPEIDLDNGVHLKLGSIDRALKSITEDYEIVPKRTAQEKNE